MKRILVTGGAGYIGSHTVHRLAEQGYTVTVYDSLENGHRESLPRNVTLITGCLSDTKKLEETIKCCEPEAVMHFAAYSEVNESMLNPQKYFNNNLLNSINLAEVMLKQGVNKLVFSSTAAVYGQPEQTLITENTIKNPVNNYGLSKLLFEEYLDRKRAELNSICLRYFNAAGAGYGIGEDHEPETHLIPLAIKTALKQKELKIFGKNYDTPDGTCVRDYVHVLDLAEAHVLALDAVQERSEKYNLSTGKGSSVLEIINTIDKFIGAGGKKVRKKFCKRREGDPATLVASYDKIKNDLGWEPRRNLEETISSAHEWHSKNPNGYATRAY